jgi:small redox-active disulfide protein 2
MLMVIKVLGSGCPNCRALEKNTMQAVNDLGGIATVEKVKDILKIIDYKVMRTPALVINEHVVMSGRVPSVEEIKEIIRQNIN